MSYLGNAETLADLTLFGVCHQYPDLNFVLVESGFGWIPYYVEALDWQWHNSGAAKAYPQMELPSFYFRRQVYGSFWFEKDTVNRMIDPLRRQHHVRERLSAPHQPLARTGLLGQDPPRDDPREPRRPLR